MQIKLRLTDLVIFVLILALAFYLVLSVIQIKSELKTYALSSQVSANTQAIQTIVTFINNQNQQKINPATPKTK